MTGRLRRRSSSTSGDRVGTPGLTTARSSASAGASVIKNFARLEEAFLHGVTNHRTGEFLLLGVHSWFNSAQLQRAQGDDGAEDAQDVEAHDHLRFVPALFLKMMVQGRHQKNPLPL